MRGDTRISYGTMCVVYVCDSELPLIEMSGFLIHRQQPVWGLTPSSKGVKFRSPCGIGNI